MKRSNRPCGSRAAPAQLFPAVIGLVVLLSHCGGIGPGEPMPPVLHGEGVPWDSSLITSWAAALAEQAGGYLPGPGAEIYTNPDKALGVVRPPAGSGVIPEYGFLGRIMTGKGNPIPDLTVFFYGKDGDKAPPLGACRTDTRGAYITLAFGRVVTDQEGSADFAVFENGIPDPATGRLFGELGRVGVASRLNPADDDFAFFPVTADNTEPVSSFEKIDPSLYRGLAGLHPGGTGTAFDLEELKDHPKVVSGTVDLSAVLYIRIADVTGDGSVDIIASGWLDDDNHVPPPAAYDSGVIYIWSARD